MARKDLLLLPIPRKVRNLQGSHELKKNGAILIRGLAPDKTLLAGKKLKSAVRSSCGFDYGILRATSQEREATIRVFTDPAMDIHEQGYHLRITPNGIQLSARTGQGIYYGVCTLVQIIERSGKRLPCMAIDDWPDFDTRGVMIDISRSKVPTMETLFGLIDLLSSWKINHVELYTEHTFAYRRHGVVWEKSSPMTGEEILRLDDFCKRRYVELAPNQNSFGHFERWLKHSEYAHLADVPGGNTLCPTDGRTIKLLAGLYDELLPHFTSSVFNVGCDETVIGKGRSKPACARKGDGRVYLDYLMKIYKLVTERGRTMAFWGDIILRHPELVPELPRDVIALDWGYEAKHPYDEQGRVFAESGVPFWVCPGTSSWISVAGRTDNCVANLVSASENGLKHGASGYLNTDWGDCGHWQYLPVSYLGFAYGAGVSWSLQANREMPIADTLGFRAFKDPTCRMGHLVYNLGNAGTVTGLYIHNDSPLFSLMQFHRLDDASIVDRMDANALKRASRQIDKAMSYLKGSRMVRADADLIVREFRNAERLLRHACRRGEVTRSLEKGTARKELRAELKALRDDMREVIEAHRPLWLARNRPGGLDEGVSIMERIAGEYA